MFALAAVLDATSAESGGPPSPRPHGPPPGDEGRRPALDGGLLLDHSDVDFAPPPQPRLGRLRDAGRTGGLMWDRDAARGLLHGENRGPRDWDDGSPDPGGGGGGGGREVGKPGKGGGGGWRWSVLLCDGVGVRW